MHLFYLSDLHIVDECTENGRRLAEFLRSFPKQGDVVILGGDIFDLFVGDKRTFRRKFSAVIAAIRGAAERGVRVYYLEGNHDFHFAPVFSGLTKLSVETEDFEIEFGGKKIYVSHGDLIDEEDTGYRFLRAITKNAFFRLFVRLLPDFLVDLIGNWSSRQSRKYTGEVDPDHQRRLRELYADFARGRVAMGADFVLVGHSHLRDQIALVAPNGRRGEYFNLGFSADALLYGAWKSGEMRAELKSFPEPGA